jgi:hypothetical protein
VTDASDPQVPDAVQEVSPMPTGEPRVDAGLQRLQDIAAAPVDEHVAIYDDVHRRLQDALADLDES